MTPSRLPLPGLLLLGLVTRAFAAETQPPFRPDLSDKTAYGHVLARWAGLAPAMGLASPPPPSAR
jgi:hypothetical protein